MNGRQLAIVMGTIMVLGATYGAWIIQKEKEAHFARATALKDTLSTMRKAIANFHDDHGRYPRTLEELVPNYIRQVPRDPVTGSTTWRLVTEETVQPSSDFTTGSPAKTETYIIDVHSGASGKDATGVPFATY